MPTLQFKGKNIIWNHHLAISYHTLDEVKELDFSAPKSKDNDNLLIEGDNLTALKALLPNYTGKIDCIYIDPPYNTGNEGWVYNDKVNSPLINEWIGKAVGLNDLTRHDKWLCMISPRLKILHDLLADDGVIFISIDENEFHHLVCILNEIFGEDNYIANYIHKNNSSKNQAKLVSVSTEYLLCYAKNKEQLKGKEWRIEKKGAADIDRLFRKLKEEGKSLDEKDNKRKFSYDLDIKAYFDFTNFSLSDDFISKVESALSDENIERKVFTVTIDEKSKTQIKDAFEEVENISALSMSYITRRFTEIIDNSFLARTLATKYLKQFEKKIGKEKLIAHFGFIVSEIVATLNDERIKQEEAIFKKQIADEKLVLAVSDNQKIGCSIPESDTIDVNAVPGTYKYYLYDDVEMSTMNTLEKSVGDILDRQEKILWWFRNKVSKSWYAIQGWQKYKIRPDFIAARKKEDGGLELVYVIESKGEMLVGNADTTYKSDVMKEMNKQKIQAYQMELPLGVLNESVEFYLIEQNKEEAEIKKLMK